MRLWIAICLVVAAATWVGGAHGAIIIGTDSAETLVGTNTSDSIYAHAGADALSGKGGPDFLYGEPGRDTIECGPGFDSPFGGSGDDMVFCDASDGKADTIDCGAGDNDVAVWRVRGTVVVNCEQTFRVTTTSDRGTILGNLAYMGWIDSYATFGGKG